MRNKNATEAAILNRVLDRDCKDQLIKCEVLGVDSIGAFFGLLFKYGVPCALFDKSRVIQILCHVSITQMFFGGGGGPGLMFLRKPAKKRIAYLL